MVLFGFIWSYLVRYAFTHPSLWEKSHQIPPSPPESSKSPSQSPSGMDLASFLRLCHERTVCYDLLSRPDATRIFDTCVSPCSASNADETGKEGDPLRVYNGAQGALVTQSTDASPSSGTLMTFPLFLEALARMALVLFSESGFQVSGTVDPPVRVRGPFD